MGHLFQSAGLTVPNSALMSPSGQPTFVGSPQQVLSRANAALPSAADMIGTDPLHPQQNTPQNLPKIGTPNIQQAADTGPAGMPNAMSPALTKGGKLATLLMSGLQGALAGRAASEQAVIQSGGRRAGGIGTGFQAGYQLPFTRAMMPLELQKQQAETGLAQAGLQPVETPYGNMPAALASKILTPYLGYQGRIGAAQLGEQGRVQAAQLGKEGRIEAAEIGKRFIPVQGVGLFDTASRQIMPETQQGIVITPEIAKDYQLPDQFIGKPMSLQNLASVQRSSVFENVPQMTAEGPVIVNRRNAQATPVTGPGGQKYSPPALASPMEVADPNNPGQTLVVPKGGAFGQAGAQSASVQVPKAAAKAEVPTKIGDQKVNFTTMIQHAELLREAAKALKNGDVQTLAGLKNAFQNEFGYAGPITARAIADAYSGEVTNVIAKGHITDAEMGKTAKTIDPSKQNFKTIDGVLTAYQNLAQSKMNMLNQQEQNAINKSQPRNGKNAPKNDPMGLR